MSILRNIQEKARQLKSEAEVLMIAYNDSRTPLKAKIIIGITVGYLLSPIDLIPDFIPILGLLDDLIIVPLLIIISIRLIPGTVLNEAREKAKNTPAHAKKRNWLFAMIIVAIWLSVMYWTIKYIKNKWY